MLYFLEPLTLPTPAARLGLLDSGAHSGQASPLHTTQAGSAEALGASITPTGAEDKASLWAWFPSSL